MQSCHYKFTRSSIHTVKALCSDCFPSHHNCATLPLSLLSSSRHVLSGCGEGRRRCWWEWTGGCMLQKLLKWQLSLYCFIRNLKIHKCTSIPHQSCLHSLQWLGFFKKKKQNLICIYVTFWCHSWTFIGITLLPSLHLVCPPRWPLQAAKLNESQLYHEQKMEHATFTEKSNTQSSTVKTYQIKSLKLLTSHLFSIVYMFIVWLMCC